MNGTEISTRRIYLIALAAGLLCLLVYLRALSCGFINLDDPYYVINNNTIRHLDKNLLIAAFTKPYLGGWLPLTHISFAIDYHFWKLNPVGYHLTNILLHAINTGMVVLIADRLCRNCLPKGNTASVSRYYYLGMLLLAGLLFGVHPLRVESVAWVSERKDVLNGLFSLGSILCYLRYVQKKEVAAEKNAATNAYLLSFVLFLFSLLAKQVSVTIPAILLIADWYPLGRLGKGRILPVLAEKIPFFAASLAVSLATIVFAAQENQLISISDLPFYVRAVVSGNAIFEYCRLLLIPVGIIPDYVLSKPIPYIYVIKTAVVVIATCAIIKSARKWPLLGATWFYFVVMLLPMLAFIHSGDDVALAARYTYLPSVGPSIAAAIAILATSKKLAESGRRNMYLVFTGSVAVFLLFNVWMSVRLITVWKDTGTFWSRVIELHPRGKAYGDRGVFYMINGKSREAVDDFSAAIKIATDGGMPSVYNLYAFRGVALGDLGRYEEAVRDFNIAISLLPHPTYYYHRGLALKALGRAQEAENDFVSAGTSPPPIDWF